MAYNTNILGDSVRRPSKRNEKIKDAYRVPINIGNVFDLQWLADCKTHTYIYMCTHLAVLTDMLIVLLENYVSKPTAIDAC